MVNAHTDYQLLFDAMSAPCAVLDEQLQYVEVNKAYETTLLRSRDEIVGRFIYDVFPEDEKRQEKLTKIFRSALAGTAETLHEVPYSISRPESEGGGKTEIWWSVHATPIPVPAGQPALFGLRVENVTNQVKAQQLKDTIAKELQHRVSNLFAVVLTIARQTTRNAGSINKFLSDFNGRIRSLARTHQALTGGDWDGMTLQKLAELELEAYAETHGSKIELVGPELRLSAVEAQSISMALHELATNAAKYGALGQDFAKLQVSWKRDNADGYEIDWHESGLSDIREPESLGFGSMILMKILPSQLNGTANREFADTSHRYRLSVPQRKEGFAVSSL